MKKTSKLGLSGVSLAVMLASGHSVAADSISEALETGKAFGDFRLRHESVEQDNALKDASALTIRSRLGYTTGTVSGFSATLEFEDSRIVASEGDYSVGPAGYNMTTNDVGDPVPIYSIIGDPEVTEVDQAFLQYKSDVVAVKVGRQVLTLDNHRFIGHVGWRQDRQTFDALSAVVSPVENLTLTYAYLDQRNRIFAEAADVNSKDHLFNVGYKTPFGKVAAYAYLLEVDQAVDNALDTYGVSFNGSTDAGDLKILYGAEFATQESEVGAAEFDADYMMFTGGLGVAGMTFNLGYEVLGSDDGEYGFSTPLATGHKFNGWADLFLGTPAQGLVDLSLTASGTVLGGKWVVAYHEFEADDSTPGVDDLGDEIDFLYAKKFGKHYNAGIKYAQYSAGDILVDTDKLWVWVGASF
ncbi:MAG: alginate export family protein [Pseudomonadales bacterium]|nr:alginate export family protein [Pseudomonadales bacterium]